MIATATVHEIDPLHDPRWIRLLKEHRLASVFHSLEWLSALQRTYGYAASALTTSGPGERLTNALLFCRVQSWLTGRRLVSVPFADHCMPLVEDEEDLRCLLSGLKHGLDEIAARYAEIRAGVGRAGVAAGMRDSASFCLHRLDLRPGLGELFHNLHDSCIRRKIGRAEKSGVSYEEGRSAALLDDFYQLMVLTRRRHHLLPQPLCWFRNLVRCLGEKIKIRVARYRDQPVGAIVTIQYKNTMIYKYGCSDSRYHNLGPMQLLMWKTIEEAKGAGLTEFDMGRSDWDNSGLLSYKDRWGCQRSRLTYMRYLSPGQDKGLVSVHVPKPIFNFAPNSLLSLAGGVLYRHIG